MESNLDAIHLKTTDLPESEIDGQLIDSAIRSGRRDVIAILQSIQREYGFLPGNVLELVAEKTGAKLASIFGVATFYSSFSLKPTGRHAVRVCEGTACHVRGAKRITDALEKRMGIKSGETSEDRLFSLSSAACFGCCSLAPVVMVGRVTCGQLDGPKAVAVVDRVLAQESG